MITYTASLRSWLQDREREAREFARNAATIAIQEYWMGQANAYNNTIQRIS